MARLRGDQFSKAAAIPRNVTVAAEDQPQLEKIKNVKVVLRLNSQQKDQETMHDKIVLTSRTEEISIGQIRPFERS